VRMALLPVLCDNCNRIWLTGSVIDGSGRVAIGTNDPSANVTIGRTTVGPCPFCQGDGHVLEGTYELTRGVTRFLASNLNADKLKALRGLLIAAQESGASADQAAKQIAAAVPDASPLAELLIHKGLPLLSLLIAIISLVLPYTYPPTSAPPVLTPQQINDIATQIIKDLETPTPPP
jgi:hypothetical protein